MCIFLFYAILECASLTAMRCLAHFLTTKNKKKSNDTCSDADVPFLIIEVPVRYNYVM